MDPTEAAARLGVTTSKAGSAAVAAAADGGGISKSEDAKYLGCYSSESFFGGKGYIGGASGANYNLIYHHAKQVGVCVFLRLSAGLFRLWVGVCLSV